MSFVVRHSTPDAVSFLFSPESGLFWAQFLKQAKCIAALQLIQYSNKHFIVRQVIYWLRTQKNHCNNWSVSLWWLRCERWGLDLFHHFTFIQWEWLSKFTRNELTLGSLKGPERREVEKNNLLFLQLYGNNLKWLYNLQAKKLSGANFIYFLKPSLQVKSIRSFIVGILCKLKMTLTLTKRPLNALMLNIGATSFQIKPAPSSGFRRRRLFCFPPLTFPRRGQPWYGHRVRRTIFRHPAALSHLTLKRPPALTSFSDILRKAHTCRCFAS